MVQCRINNLKSVWKQEIMTKNLSCHLGLGYRHFLSQNKAVVGTVRHKNRVKNPTGPVMTDRYSCIIQVQC